MKKKEITENKGITGNSTDYNVYHLTAFQRIFAIIVGVSVGFAAGYIYFENNIIGII